MRRLMLGIAALGGCGSEPASQCDRGCAPEAQPVNSTGYHGDARRLGWNDHEVELVPSAISERGLTIRWQSPVLDAETIDGVTYPPHLYAVPLWVDELERDGSSARTIFAATSNGWVYAIEADERGCSRCGAAPGDVLWATRLVDAVPVGGLDGGMPLGVLSTPALDLEAGRLYVAALDRARGWLVFALDASDGSVVTDWPVALDDSVVSPLNLNGPATLQPAELVSQRGALGLSPDGDRLYVPFGTYRGDGVGWLVAIDIPTATPSAAFSSAPWTEQSSNGGIWGAGGPTIDDDGNLWITTGNAPAASAMAAGTWGNSLLHLDPALRLLGTYTPFNYCWLDFSNMDLASSTPLLLPTLPGSPTPNTVAFGGKQGNVYLVDRDALTPAGVARPACSDAAQADRSLLPPDDQPQFGTRGPLNVFGPYSELFGQLDYAKMRSRLAYAELRGQRWLFAAGATKASEDSEQSIPPAVAKLRVVAGSEAPAYLEIDAFADAVAFVNPGSPSVSSNADGAGVVWVLDENAPRTASLLDPATPGPILYAFDADTLALLWRSEAGALARGGKYGTPLVAHGRVVVGTDRIVALGLP